MHSFGFKVRDCSAVVLLVVGVLGMTGTINFLSSLLTLILALSVAFYSLLVFVGILLFEILLS